MCHIVTRTPKPPPAPPDDNAARKERVIHTRVPEKLEVELRERAEALGMSVSNLVRNVLGNALGLVGDVVADSKAIARAAKSDVPTSSTPPDQVLGWTPATLAKNAVCARCNEILPRGSDAAISADGSRLVACRACLSILTTGA